MGCGGGGSGDGAFGEFVIKFLNQSSRNPVFVPIPVPINVAVSHTATIVLYEIDYYYYLPLFLFHFFFFFPLLDLYPRVSHEIYYLSLGIVDIDGIER